MTTTENTTSTATARCQCGEWSGDACSWIGHRSDMVRVEVMPEQHRASHEAAGNRGIYPHNGAYRLNVSRECADLIVATDGEWCSIV
jgi:hypothetical protein